MADAPALRSLGAGPSAGGAAAPVPAPPEAAVVPLERDPGSPRPRPGWHVPWEGVWWLLAAVAMWAVGWMKGINLLLLLAYLMGALWVLNLLACRRVLRRLEARREVAGPVFAGEPFPWAVEVRAPRPGARTGWAAEERAAGAAFGWFVAGWDGAAPLHLRREVTLPRRGAYRFAPLLAVSGFPFGLVRRAAELAGPEEVLALPRPRRVDRRRLRDWLLAATGGDGRRHQLLRNVLTQETDVHGLRPFRAGDSPRWIHWRTTARRGELMIREYDDADSPDLTVVLDPWRPADCPPDSPEAARLEEAVTLAASVCWEWCREAGLRLALLSAGPGPACASGRTGRDLALRCLEVLAREPGGPDVPPESWLPLLSPGRGGQPLLLVSSRPASPLRAVLARRAGRPVALAAAGDTLPWYEGEEVLHPRIEDRESKGGE